MKYYLGEASQNTFILFDCLESSELPAEFLQKVHWYLKKEKRDDALILMDGQKEGETFSVCMKVLGLDGKWGEFCGNGALVCAAYLYECYGTFQYFFLRTMGGNYPLRRHEEGLYSVKLPPASFMPNEKFVIHFSSGQEGLFYVEVLEPHLVRMEQMSDEELFTLGRKLSGQKEFFPLGINVNACHVMEDGHLHVRTYERGVQRLTQSCGTGSLACVAWCQKVLKRSHPNVMTRGGLLQITMDEEGMELKGPAFFSCKGKSKKWG